MPRAKTTIVEKIVYKDRAPWLTLDNIKMIKQWVATVGPIVIAAYLWVIPQMDAKAADYIKNKLDSLGISAENIAGLNKNLEDMQKKDDERTKTIDDLKGDINKIIIILEQQQRQQVPVPVYPTVQQVVPQPIPLVPAAPVQ